MKSIDHYISIYKKYGFKNSIKNECKYLKKKYTKSVNNYKKWNNKIALLKYILIKLHVKYNHIMIISNILHITAYIKKDDIKLIYYHIPKVANTSLTSAILKKSLLNKNIGWDQLLKYAIENKMYSIIKTKYIKNNYFSFAFVRNPFTRLISAYENLIVQPKSLNGNVNIIFQKYLWGYLSNISSFPDFINHICNIPNLFMDQHLKHQYKYLFTIWGSLKVKNIYKFENLSNEWEKLSKKYCLPKLPHKNKSINQSINWMDYYNLNLAEKVYKKYKKDFMLFDYDEEYQKLIEYLTENNKL